MALCDFRASHRTRTTYANSAALHAQYLTREGPYTQTVSAAHYVTRAERYAMGKEDLIAKGGAMPAWAHGNHEIFWAAADQYERQGGRLCDSWILSLPRELSRKQNVNLARDIVRATMGDRYAHTWAMHEVTASDGKPQPHLHLMYSGRLLDGVDRAPSQFFRRWNHQHPERGGAQKDPAMLERHHIDKQRQLYSDLANVHLERAGVEARMNPNSLEARGLHGRKMELHLGPARKSSRSNEQIERREIVAEENATRRRERETLKPEEERQARAYWQYRRQELGITDVYALTPEILREKNHVWIRSGQPGRAIPLKTLEELETQRQTLEQRIERQAAYGERVHAEIMAEESRQQKGLSRSAQDEAQIEWTLADNGASIRRQALKPVQQEPQQEKVFAGREVGALGIDDETNGQGAKVHLDTDRADRGWGKTWSQQNRAQQQGRL